MPKDLLEKGEQGIAVYIMRIRDLKKLGTSPKNDPENCRTGQCSPFIDTVWTFSVFLAKCPAKLSWGGGWKWHLFFLCCGWCVYVSSVLYWMWQGERERHTHTQPSGGTRRPELRRTLTTNHSLDWIAQFPKPGSLVALEPLAIQLCLDPTWLFFLLSQHVFNSVTGEAIVLLLGGWSLPYSSKI